MDDRYDDYANHQRAVQQQREWDDRIALDRRLAVRRGIAEKELQDFYGPGKSKLENEIHELNRNLAAKGVLGAWYRLRHGKRARQTLSKCEKSLENLIARMNERQSVIEQREQTAREQLNIKLASRRERLDVHLKMRDKFPKVKTAFESGQVIDKLERVGASDRSPTRSR